MKPERSAQLVRIVKWGMMIALALFVTLTICLLLSVPHGPLPPPKVALNLTGFTNWGDTVFALMSFTNIGPTEVHVWDSVQLWQIEAETPRGWITNTAPFATRVGEGVPSGSDRIFAVPLPSGTIQWRITTTFGYAKRYHVPTELSSKIWRSPLVQRNPGIFADSVSWLLDLIPNAPDLLDGEVSTPFMTNRPAAGGTTSSRTNLHLSPQ